MDRLHVPGSGEIWMRKLIVPVLLLVGLLLYFGQGLQEISLENFVIFGIRDVSIDSFVIDGDLYVNNPSDVSVPIQTIEYEVYLKENGERIGFGSLPSFTLENKMTSNIKFHQTIEWVPAGNLALDLVTKETVMIVIRGELRLNLPTMREISIPFTQETDIKAYVQQFVTAPVKNPLVIGDSQDLPKKEIPLRNLPVDSIITSNPLDVVI